MNAKKLITSFGFSLILLMPAIIKPMKANAGGGSVRATTLESSSYAGDSFNNGGGNFTPFTPASGLGFSYDENGAITLSPDIEEHLQVVAINIINQRDTKNTALLALLVGGCDLQDQHCHIEQDIDEVKVHLYNLKIHHNLVDKLLKSLQGLLNLKSSSLPGVHITESKSLQLQKEKNLISNQTLVENNEKVNVDIRQLNTAINTYDKIVLESSPELVRQLAQDPQFLEIGNILKQLRTALKTNS